MSEAGFQRACPRVWPSCWSEHAFERRRRPTKSSCGRRRTRRRACRRAWRSCRPSARRWSSAAPRRRAIWKPPRRRWSCGGRTARSCRTRPGAPSNCLLPPTKGRYWSLVNVWDCLGVVYVFEEAFGDAELVEMWSSGDRLGNAAGRGTSLSIICQPLRACLIEVAIMGPTLG